MIDPRSPRFQPLSAIIDHDQLSLTTINHYLITINHY